MTDHRLTTHGHDCWSWGAGHYDCAVAEIERLREQLRLATVEQPAEQHPDDAAVDRFAAAMKAKLKKKRQEGRGGWQSMTSEQLSALLHEHVRKGDPVDVANLAMMLHQNGQVIESPATVVTDEMVEALRAEVERLKSMTAVTMGVGSGDGNLFVHGDYDSIKAAQALVLRAELLAEALRLIESAKDRGFDIDYARGVAQSALLRDQEEGHEQ